MSNQVNYTNYQVYQAGNAGANTPEEAAKILDDLKTTLPDALKSLLDQNSVFLFRDAFENPGKYGWSGHEGPLVWANDDSKRQVNLSSFLHENYASGTRSNKLTAYFFALCGLKTYDNDQAGEVDKSKDIVNIFQQLKDKLSPMFDENGPIQHLSQFGTVEEQRAALAMRSKGQAVFDFASKMCMIIDLMKAYCAKAQLNDGNDPCYNITRQWESQNYEKNPDIFIPGHTAHAEDSGAVIWIPDTTKDGGYKYKPDSPDLADANWHYQDVVNHRRANAPYNPLDPDIGQQIRDFFNDLSSLKDLFNT